MGKYKNGILGSFTGKVGNIIGSTWNGIPYMRAVPANVKDPKTPKQLAQRQRFGLITSLLRKFRPVVMIGFKHGAGNMNPINRAASYNLRNAVGGEYPDQYIEYSQFVLARGELTGVNNPQVSAGTAGEIVYTWTDNSGEGSAQAGDNVIATVYCPELDTVAYKTNAALREDESFTFSMPVSFEGESVETYLFFTSSDESIASDSVYTGQVTIPES